MKIKVNYHMTEEQKKIWGLTKHLSGEEYEPEPEKIFVKGLKKVSKNISNDCREMTGLSENEYQKQHGIAFSE